MRMPGLHLGGQTPHAGSGFTLMTIVACIRLDNYGVRQGQAL